MGEIIAKMTGIIKQTKRENIKKIHSFLERFTHVQYSIVPIPYCHLHHLNQSSETTGPQITSCKRIICVTKILTDIGEITNIESCIPKTSLILKN